MAIETDKIAATMVAMFEPLFEKLAASENDYNIPSPELQFKAIRGCINKRNGTWRKTKPTESEESALLWDLVKFHRGSGSLWGYPWFADAEQRDQLDTLALLILGNKSSAGEAWRKAIYG